MGKIYLRKIQDSECRWTDKSAPKHKHNFSIEANVALRTPNYIEYFHVIKCASCNSFKCIPTKGSMYGFINTPIEGLPTVKLYSSHKIIGFRNAVLDE